MTTSLNKSWWLLALRGIFLIIFALIALFAPDIVILTMIMFFGFLLLISGFTLIFEGFTAADKGHRTLRIIDGIINIVTGIIVLLLPLESLAVIMIFISAWAVVSGLLQIAAAIKMRKVIENEFLTIVGGLISIIFGIVILLNVFEGAQAIVMVFGIFALITGILLVGLSFRVKKVVGA